MRAIDLEITYVLEGRPVTWQRTTPDRRSGRAHVTEHSQRLAKEAHRWAAIHAMRLHGIAPGNHVGEYEVEVVGYWPDGNVGDSDRLASLVMDALQGVAYRSDKQVKRETGDVRIDRARPRTEVCIRRRVA